MDSKLWDDVHVWGQHIAFRYHLITIPLSAAINYDVSQNVGDALFTGDWSSILLLAVTIYQHVMR